MIIYNFLTVADWVVLAVFISCVMVDLFYEKKNFLNGHISMIVKFLRYIILVFSLMVVINVFEKYVNPVFWSVIHDKFITIISLYVFMFIYSIYNKLGGVSFKEFESFVGVFRIAFRNKNWEVLKENDLKLFSKERRIRVMLSRFSNFEEKVDVILEIVRSVTRKLIKYTKSYNDWGVFTDEEACEFIGRIKDISSEAYGILNNIGLSHRDRGAFSNIIKSMSPAFNRRIKNILTNSDYTKKQRFDLTVQELGIIGKEIEGEVVELVKVIQEYEHKE